MEIPKKRYMKILDQFNSIHSEPDDFVELSASSTFLRFLGHYGMLCLHI